MFRVKIETGNAAFADAGKGAEVARILRKLADAIEPVEEGDYGRCVDYNGNVVGDWKLT